MTERSFEINTGWSDVYTVDNQPITTRRQDIPENVYNLAVNTEHQYNSSIDSTYHQSVPESLGLTPGQPIYPHPVTNPSTHGYFGTAPFEEAYPFPEAVNPMLQYDPSLSRGMLSNTTAHHWGSVAHHQTGPASSLYTAIPENDIRLFLASTAGALSHQTYPIVMGAGHHQMQQVAYLPLSAQHWPPTSSVHFDAAIWHSAPSERPLSPQPASRQSSRLVQPTTQALVKRKRVERSEVIEEGTYRFQDNNPVDFDNPMDFDHNGYHRMPLASDMDTTRTASFSGMSSYQNRMGPTDQEVASINKVIDSDTGGSLAIRQSLECNGKIGFCGLQHHWVVRPFEKNELLVADFLSQVLSSQSLGWHIYWITPTSFAPNWWPRIDGLSNIKQSERQQLFQFLSCFRTHNLDIHQHGTCAIAREEIEVTKGRHRFFKKNARLHTFQKSTERDLTNLVKTAELILDNHGIAWKTSAIADNFSTAHPARYPLTRSNFQLSSSGITSVQTLGMARDYSSVLPTSSSQGLIPCSIERMTFNAYGEVPGLAQITWPAHMTYILANDYLLYLVKSDSNHVNISVTKRPRMRSANPLEYTQLACSEPIMGKKCGGELLACSYRRQEPVQLLTGKYLELFKLIYARQTIGKEIDWNVFAPEFRGRNKGGSRSLGHLVQGEGHKGILLRYMTNCRQIICQTHYHLGTCPILQDQLQKRGLRNIQLQMTGLEDSFQAIKSLPRDVWRGGRPALFEAMEVSVTEG